MHGTVHAVSHLVRDIRRAGATPGLAGSVGNLGELAERDAGDAIERAAQAQLREHAIDAIDRLVDVLDDENARRRATGVCAFRRAP